ncbi:MAG TPA: helix-turn-helix transcriptional regulator [Actinomycetota bacterium]|nr:helix-turn-helix transcriptional regulator [Actinomycetota bacterium]
MDAARVILEARLRAGLTQEQLGRRTGMVITALSKLERGLVRPRVDTLERLLRGCGYTLDVTPRLGADVDRGPIRRLLERSPNLRLPRWTDQPLRFLHGHHVRLLLVGATAARYHGAPVPVRWIEILPRPDPQNRARLRNALRRLRVRMRVEPPPLRSRGTQYVEIDRGGVAIWWSRRGIPSYDALLPTAHPWTNEPSFVRVASLDDLIRIASVTNADHTAVLCGVREEVDALRSRSDPRPSASPP